MIELVKKHIRMNRQGSGVTSQMTLDDDFNVPDTMDDVDQLILDSGEIQMESVKNLGEKAVLRGKLAFRVLYKRPGGGTLILAGSIPFDETVNVPGLKEQDFVQAGWELDDLNVGLINSRKLNVKALVTFKIRSETLYEAEAAQDAAFDGAVKTLRRKIQVAAMAARRKDTFRIREILTLAGNKPNIDTLLWQDVRLRGVSTKPLDGKIHIDGELMIFIIYEAEDDGMPIQCLEESIPFSGEVELEEAVEEMIPFIPVRLVHKEVEVNPDSDGEMRELSLDAVVELDMRLYEEQQVEILSDLYALDREAQPETGTACFDQIAMRNTVKTRMQEKMSLGNTERILQICHSDGVIKIDEAQIKEDGLHIEGVLEVRVLYLTADDNSPVGARTEVLPFHVIAEASGLSPDSSYQMEPGLEQLTAVMSGGDGVEVKALISIDILVLTPVCEQVILGVLEEPLNTEKLKIMPGIIGYIVRPGDTLWRIAKEFHTTEDAVMAANGLTDSLIHPGDKLILVKEVREMP